MENERNERFIILVLTFASVGLSLVNILMKWEFWMPPVIIIGVVLLWLMHVTETPEYNLRMLAFFLYALLIVFYHGVHTTSFFDISMVAALAMVIFSFLNKLFMMNIFLLEYAVLILIQLTLLGKDSIIFSDRLSISRLLLHMAIVGMVYFSCNKAITDRKERDETDRERVERLEAVDADMEDFLSNISHELRTPVNVVNGMSDMLIKRNAGDEAFSIKAAGIRLAYQIEDIQDYTECKRNKVILDEDDYISTSLINDVVAGFKLLDNEKKLELIVDMDPQVPMKMTGDLKKLHKIFRHLLENALKFTRKGGVYVRVYAEDTFYGVNLCIEMTDTGIGMDQKSIAAISEGMYQVNKKRNRSTGGIGLGLFIVYGFAHRMGGFVKIESDRKLGTTVRVTIPQKVADNRPCLTLSKEFTGDIIFHVRSDKYKVPRVREFYRAMASNLASGIKVHLYSAQSVSEIEHLKEKLNISNVFMGQEEYEENPEYFDEMSRTGIVVAVSAASGFKPNPGSSVLVMPKPLYAYPVIKVINEGIDAGDLNVGETVAKPVFRNVRALVVDDEPMNLVVATGLFREYEMLIDTASSGREAIKKYRADDYDVVFMDHMMPEMDGVEAMKMIKEAAIEKQKHVKVVALTANAVSGAREMFIKEGFDGFIAKPINLADFERVMLRILPESNSGKGGQKV